jgi:hypothetical protein
VKANDIVIIKFRGMRTKFRIMGVDEIIKENCFQQQTNYSCTKKENYNDTLNKFDIHSTIFKTKVIGDKISEHLNRVYLEMLT